MSITTSRTIRARITSQGQITVPKIVRDALGARPGDDLEFEPRGRAFVVRSRPRVSILDFAGIASDAAARIPSTADELDRLIEAAADDAAVRRHAKLLDQH